MTEFNPPTDFILGESTIDGIEVFKPRPKEDESQPVIDFDCPRCGANISSSTACKRITNFCRTCQPGGLKHGM
jgi:hypothetical protein